MSTLETILPGFTPSPLQQAAIDYIQQCQQQLQRLGLNLHTSMELEFMIMNKNGNLIPGAINLDAATKWLKAQPKESLPYFDKLDSEGFICFHPEVNRSTTQYEVTLDDVTCRHPINLAAAIQRLKTQTLPEMLKASTCLQGDAGALIARGTFPSFEPHPDVPPPPESANAKSESSALHVNISITNNKGYNLFAQSPDLMRHCTERLLFLQNEAGLSLLPTSQSLKRIGANLSAPGGLGVMVEKRFNGNRYTSVSMRGINEQAEKNGSKQNLRVENRLPGADADPFVAMAVTCAAVMSAVHDHLHVLNRLDGVKEYIINPKPALSGKTHPIPTTHEALVAKMQASRYARNMLGEKLYTEILKAYGPDTAPAR